MRIDSRRFDCIRVGVHGRASKPEGMGLHGTQLRCFGVGTSVAALSLHSKSCARVSSGDGCVYRRLMDQEYAVSAIQEVECSDELKKNEIAPLRNCNPLLEKGNEHRSFCEEDPKKRGPIDSSPKKERKSGVGRAA